MNSIYYIELDWIELNCIEFILHRKFLVWGIYTQTFVQDTAPGTSIYVISLAHHFAQRFVYDLRIFVKIWQFIDKRLCKMKRQTYYIDWCTWRWTLQRRLCMICQFLSKIRNPQTNACAKFSTRWISVSESRWVCKFEEKNPTSGCSKAIRLH